MFGGDSEVMGSGVIMIRGDQIWVEVGGGRKWRRRQT